MTKKEPKQYGPKTKKESRMEIICGVVSMVLMVALIIILIVASMTGDSNKTIGDKPWAVICSSVFGGLIVISLVVYITLKVLFMKQRRIKEIKPPVESAK